MTNSPTTIIDELASAFRGVLYLFVGDRRAAGHFDFSQRGLAGSFIAFLAASLFNALLPRLLGISETPGSMSRGLLMAGFLYAMQIGFCALALRQMKRLDGLVPYLVADNWATFFITLVSALVAILPIDPNVAVIVIGIAVIVVEINIARLIVTLSPLQIAMFLIAQLVGVSIGLLFIGMIMPLPPEVAAQLQSG